MGRLVDVMGEWVVAAGEMMVVVGVVDGIWELAAVESKHTYYCEWYNN